MIPKSVGQELSLPYPIGDLHRYEAEDFLLIPNTATDLRAVLAVSGNTDFHDLPEASPRAAGVLCFVAIVIEPEVIDVECPCALLRVVETGVES